MIQAILLIFIIMLVVAANAVCRKGIATLSDEQREFLEEQVACDLQNW